MTSSLRLWRVVLFFFSFCHFDSIFALTIAGRPNQIIKPYKRELLQDIVTWDEHSLFVYGERVLFFSGEFHPFRLPVTDLWLDVFQKIKALGYSGVSFYVDWALLEGNPGHFTAEGIFALEPFFDAASEAGIYLLARPGPYINAEVSGGGFPGWLQRDPAILRTNETLYETATDNYAANVGAIIAKGQITNGGPVILFQPENEYTYAANDVLFPDIPYFEYVEQQFRNAGIVVPFISNDAAPLGHFAPNATASPGAVDIYGHDGYPLGFDCANPYTWPSGDLPTNYHTLHLTQSPLTPYSLVEFQGGSFDPWGGLGYDKCAILLNNEFERVFYKNDFSFGVTIFNLYMTYGGTNWGNLGHPGGYTSYDYGAAIMEDRTITREKYSEAKLEANFLQASPAYLTATPGNLTTGVYAPSSIAVTPLFGDKTNFYVVRHANYSSLDSTSYTLTVSTSIGSVTIPQLGGSLTLNGRDSKIHVTDYDVGGPSLIYSSAEVFSWKNSGNGSVVVLYGGQGETHELAVSKALGTATVEGSAVTMQTNGTATIINWQVSPTRSVLHFNGLTVYLLWRNEAYDFWTLELPAASPIGNYTSPSKSSVIVKAGYLVRGASISGSSLYLTGDLNATASLEVIATPSDVSSVYFNGEEVSTESSNGRLSGSLTYSSPTIDVPDLTSLDWKYLDNLPEIQPSYDDSLWTVADHTYTNNTVRNLTTPTSLYADDYGYHTGSLLYRGHFTSTGNESTFYVETQGGSAFGASIWVGSTFLGSWTGYDAAANGNQTVTLPTLTSGTSYILTIVIDHMGLDENWTPGLEQMKDPRGVLDYTLSGHSQSDITWKLTGNLGGEQYRDQTRGPLNEGGMYAERQGYHQPQPPSSNWTSGSPLNGLSSAGINFYTTSFDLNVPAGYDVPMSFAFINSTSGSNGTTPDYRVQLFVNGYQFGKYVNNVGPQTVYPVPEGILNYNSTNYLALSLWSLDAGGASLESFGLVADAVIQSGYLKPGMSPQPAWMKRSGAY